MSIKRNLSLLTLSLLVIGSTAFAQAPKKATPSPKSKPIAAKEQIKGDLLPVDPNVIIGKLPNGLTYYIRKNTEPKNRAVLYLVNKVGSVSTYG